MKFRHIAADFRIVSRTYFRNPVALFFSLIFPIILIGLFGLIFSAAGSGAVTLVVVNEDHNAGGVGYSNESVAFLQALNDTTVVSVHVVSVSPQNFSTYLGQNDVSTGLVIPAGFESDYLDDRPVNLTVFTNPQDAASSGTVLGAVQGVAAAFNLHAVCGTGSCAPVIGFTTRNVGSQVYTYIDYLIPGLIGFSILTSPMFSMVDVASSYRKDGIFRQLSLTPITRAEWLTSRILWYVALTFVTAGIMIGAGVALFGAHVTLTAGLIPYLLVGPFFFVSLGMLAGSVAKTPESAALIGNIITFPMMFLSGTFFQVSSMPPGLQAFAKVLPLYYVIDGMNQVMLFQNYSRALTDLVVVLVGSVVVFLLAVRLFKWRDE
ncbi:MAG TPA: ABC transporter permease [Thermoplasmata archaeon]|nr:ABC transporter permease [Thermoplasmata archaeon]